MSKGPGCPIVQWAFAWHFTYGTNARLSSLHSPHNKHLQKGRMDRENNWGCTRQVSIRVYLRRHCITLHHSFHSPWLNCKRLSQADFIIAARRDLAPHLDTRQKSIYRRSFLVVLLSVPNLNLLSQRCPNFYFRSGSFGLYISQWR